MRRLTYALLLLGGGDRGLLQHKCCLISLENTLDTCELLLGSARTLGSGVSLAALQHCQHTEHDVVPSRHQDTYLPRLQGDRVLLDKSAYDRGPATKRCSMPSEAVAAEAGQGTDLRRTTRHRAAYRTRSSRLSIYMLARDRRVQHTHMRAEYRFVGGKA